MSPNIIPKALAAIPTEAIDLSADAVGYKGLAFNITDLIKMGITILIAVVSLTFFFMLVMGGLKWISSGGDEKKLAGARNQVTNALIGLVIVFSTWALASLIKSIFGVDILKFNIPKMGP